MLYKGRLPRDLEQRAQFAQNSGQQCPGWELCFEWIAGSTDKVSQEHMPPWGARGIDAGREERGSQGQSLDNRHKQGSPFQAMTNLLTTKTQGQKREWWIFDLFKWCDITGGFDLKRRELVKWSRADNHINVHLFLPALITGGHAPANSGALQANNRCIQAYMLLKRGRERIGQRLDAILE